MALLFGVGVIFPGYWNASLPREERFIVCDIFCTFLRYATRTYEKNLKMLRVSGTLELSRRVLNLRLEKRSFSAGKS